MRESVKNFVNEMETKLQENDWKGGWKQSKNTLFLQKKLLEEVAEYFVALNDETLTGLPLVEEFISMLREAECEKENCGKETTKEEQQKELADIGNICMMLFDNSVEE
jgi:hypothetical protein